MKNTTNSIEKMTANLVSKASLTNNEISTLANDAGKAYAQGHNAWASFSDKALALHNGGVRYLKQSTKAGKACSTSALLRDSFMAGLGNLADGTKKNALMTFTDTINTGKVHTDSNKSRSNAKAEGGKKSPKQAKAIDALVAQVFNHADFANLPEELQHDVREYLETEGYEIEE